jgi:hypothetical protein
VGVDIMGDPYHEGRDGAATFTQVLRRISTGFETNVKSVYELAEFDHLVLDFAIRSLESVEKSAEKCSVTNYRMRVTKALEQVRKIREHDSMRHQYQRIFNQCVVLLVSYFGSALHDLFSAGIARQIATRATDKLLSEELKLTVGEIVDLAGDVSERVADLLVRKGDISFQDMRSTNRAFEKFCGHLPDKDQDCNNIILGQACRHVIVHSGAIVGKKCLAQVKAALPRTIKPDLAEGPVEFSVEELEELGKSMLAFVRQLVGALGDGGAKG